MTGFKIEFVCQPFQFNKPHGIVFSDEKKKLTDLQVQKMSIMQLDTPHLTPDIFSNLFIIP